MSDLIDRDALLHEIRHGKHEPFYDGQHVADWYKQCVNKAPSVSAEPKWISVGDRLPEKPSDYFKDGQWWMVSGEDFLVADTNGKVYEAHWTYGCNANNYFWYKNSLTPLTNITHWMPLPEPPEKKIK